MFKFFTIFLSLIFFNFSAFSQDYKIEDLINIAEQNSANIKAAQFSAVAQQRFANQQKYFDNPYFSFERIGKENVYRISQSLPIAGKLQKKYNVEEAEFRILDVRKNNLALAVKSEIFSLIYKYQSLKKKIELTKKRLNRLSIIDKYLSSIALDSPTKRSQGHITKNKIKLVERDLMKFQNELYQTWSSANIYLQLESEPTNIFFKWFDGKDYKGKDFFINFALENNLELKEQELLIRKYKSELAASKVLPDVTVSVAKKTTSIAGVNQESSGIGLAVAIPLINRNQEKNASIKSKIKAEEFALEFKQNKLTQQISNDINEFETSLKLANNFPISNIDKILSHLAGANNDFKKGVLDFITYIELDAQEYQTIYAILDTQEELAASYAELMLKTGNFTLPQNN